MICYSYAIPRQLFSLHIRNAVPLSIPTPAPSPTHCTVTDTKLGGFDINEEIIAIVNIHSTNMDEAYWTNPDDFYPERLLNANNELDKDKCNRSITVDLERRRCLGEHLAKLKTFLLLANLLQICSLTKV